MRQKRFWFYLLIQAAVILAVLLLFKVNADKKIAATEAGGLFVAVPVILMAFETLISGFRQRLWLFGVLQFWLLFALPIIGLRLLNWDVDFKDLQLLGISGPTLHFWSSKSYFLMMLITAWAGWKNRRRAS
jgi:hypothetical protein